MTTLQSRYQQLDRGETGGFGRVIHARDTWLDRDIAIKILDPLMALEEGEQKRFQQEARTLARLSHPNIPSIYDVILSSAIESDDGEPHFQILFEFISGQNLRDRLRDEGALPLDDARLWFSQLASALQHAHDLGVIHRDVKPENIIVRDSRESCCLVDFGIALTDEDVVRITKTGYVIGTPGYMSPEQESGEELDGRTDIFNLGVCLYEALAGSPLPRGDYRPLATINEGTPPAIDELVQACLEPKDLRLGSAELFARRLAEALRPRVALAQVLAEGRLADLGTALSEMTPVEYAERPAGQRMLIHSKVADLAASGRAELELPLMGLLAQLVHLGTRLSADEYGEVVDLTLEWGFEHTYATGEVGKARLRRSLADEAATLPPSLHALEASKVLAFFEERGLETFEENCLNGARDLVSNLLANRACEDEDQAAPPAALRRAIDMEQRGRGQGATATLPKSF